MGDAELRAVDIVGSRLPVYRRFVFRQPISEALTEEQAEEPGEKVPGWITLAGDDQDGLSLRYIKYTRRLRSRTTTRHSSTPTLQGSTGYPKSTGGIPSSSPLCCARFRSLFR